MCQQLFINLESVFFSVLGGGMGRGIGRFCCVWEGPCAGLELKVKLMHEVVF